MATVKSLELCVTERANKVSWLEAHSRQLNINYTLNILAKFKLPGNIIGYVTEWKHFV